MSGDFLWIYSISVRCSLPQACQQAPLIAAVLSTSRTSCVRHRQIQGIENPSNYSQFFFFGDLFARLFMENLFFLPVECLHRVIEMAFDSGRCRFMLASTEISKQFVFTQFMKPWSRVSAWVVQSNMEDKSVYTMSEHCASCVVGMLIYRLI